MINAKGQMYSSCSGKEVRTYNIIYRCSVHECEDCVYIYTTLHNFIVLPEDENYVTHTPCCMHPYYNNVCLLFLIARLQNSA